MKSLRALAAAGIIAATAPGPAIAADISGAGATFPYPIYAKWADAYKAETGVGLDYRSIGSGAGILQIQAKAVTFGATDMPLAAADLDRFGLVQFPTVMGGVVPVLNVEGIKSGDLTLDGQTLAKIFLGEIKTWNDPAIRKLNPSARLPSQPIAIVRRSDGSGTTFLFTDYLSKVSADWRSKVGASTAVEWPVGIGAKGNEGVADGVARTAGSIGYVEYAYARQSKLDLRRDDQQGRQAGRSDRGIVRGRRRRRQLGRTPGFGVVLTNQAGLRSWPITGATFILMHKQPEDPAAAARALQFFAWAFANGGKLAEELDYVPMPAAVVVAIQNVWKAHIKDASGKPIFAGQAPRRSP